MYKTIIVNIDKRGVVEIRMNRPEVRNAFDDVLIAEMTESLNELANHQAIKVLKLTSTGEHFSAGADLNWMMKMKFNSELENRKDALNLAALFKTLAEFPKPTIAIVKGCAFGGAVGLSCCCDFVYAEQDAIFCLSEVKLGLVPATISPYVVSALGMRATRHYMMSAEEINIEQALKLGLVSKTFDKYKLCENVELFIEKLLGNGSVAMRRCKELLKEIENKSIDEEVINYTSELIAEIRVSDEAQEGLSKFLYKKRNAEQK